jgi:hypothetical protein
MMPTDGQNVIRNRRSSGGHLGAHARAHLQIGLFVIAIIGCQQRAAALFAEEGTTNTAKYDPETMIDALANDNSEPEVRRNSWIALFPEGYDWEEEKRARTAFITLARDEREETWEELVQHVDDRRYAVTMANNGGYPMNYTVGGLCRKIAYHRLCAAFEDELPVNSLGIPVHPRLRLGDNLADWRAERPTERLYELQIESSRQAVKDIQGIEFLALAAREESCEKIQKRIERLRATQKPAFRKLPFDGYEWYSARRAAEMWAEHRNKKQKERAKDRDGE